MLLNCHTYYSFCYGTVSPQELLQLAQEKLYGSIAITDINNTSAALNFVRLAQGLPIHAVLGIDFRNGNNRQYIGLARNNAGFMQLNQFLSHHRHRQKPFPDAAPAFEDAYIIYPFAKKSSQTKLAENEFVSVQPQELNKLKFSDWRHRQQKLVALQTVTFRNKRDFNTHRLLRAIQQNTLLSKLPESEQGLPHHIMPHRDELLQTFSEFPQLLQNSERLLNSCEVFFEFGDEFPHKNRKTYTNSEEGDWEKIKQLCRDGLPYRYPNPTEEIFKRIDLELEMIRQKGFLAYFLITWDITSYARSNGWFYVGRGSGANSIVAYLLRITDVDPIDLDLYFERFINLYRKNPPDFDIDFSWKERDRVTRYIFDTFGHEHTALLGTYVTFQKRAVVRELGKVFGLPKHEIDKLGSGRYNPAKLDELSRLVLRYGNYIHGFPSHLSVHAGGIIISEKPVNFFTATDLPPKGFATTHFDMVVAEDAGLYKYDILGQRGLGKIKDSLELISQNYPAAGPVDIHNLNLLKEDKKVKELLREGNAIGCFYVESPAMRMLLKKLRVEDYLGLVAASSVIRPGVAQSGMMREYILRYRHPERRKDAHPVLLDIMPDTYGVMVYQEDVIKVAHYFAGLTLGEADMLRRGMSGKFRSREEFKKVEDKFFKNCNDKGIEPAMANEIWRQIESFAGYAFAKGHSASFAVESFQCLYLKAHYPLEYIVATVNNGGGFYSRELYLHDARLHGATVHAPCVNKSDILTGISGRDIYLGLDLIQGLEQHLMKQIVAERQYEGDFTGLHNLLQRAEVSLEQLVLLIRAGAFGFTGKSKKELLWEAHFLFGGGRKSNPQRDLFRTQPKQFELPPLHQHLLEDAFDELELLNFPLCNPFLLADGPWENTLTARELKEHLGRTITLPGYLVTVKHTRTGTGKSMYFGTFLDREGQWVDTVHFPPVAERYPFNGRGIYHITGKVVEEFGFYSLEVKRLQKMAFKTDPRYDGEIGKRQLANQA